MANKMLTGLTPLRYHLQLTRASAVLTGRNEYKGHDIGRAGERSVGGSERAFGVFKLNHTRAKFINHFKEFRFCPQQRVFQLKWQVA